MDTLVFLILVMAITTGAEKGTAKTHQLTKPGFTLKECHKLARESFADPIVNTEEFYILDAYCKEVKK